MQKPLLDRGNSITQDSAWPTPVAIRLQLDLRERSDEIGPADDADDPVVTQYRDALDAVRGQQSRDLVDFGVLADRDDRRGHNIACSPFRGPDAGQEFGVKRLSFC